MPNYGNSDNPGLNRLISGQSELITRGQALSAGMTVAALRHRLRPGGPWSVVLPAVYHCAAGSLTYPQREVAALLYAGDGCVITGTAALLRQGVSVPPPDTVEVLVAWERGKQSYDFVRVRRTRRMPGTPALVGGLPYARPARAVADAIRSGMDARSARALAASAVQRRACSVADLVAEVRVGPARGSAPLRAALADVLAGNRSVAEGDLRRLIVRGGLPAPLYNPRLFAGQVFLACPDAWWPDAGVACEVDSAEWHLSPDDWKKTQARQARMTARGIMVLPYPPSRIRTDGKTIVAEIRSAIENGLDRPRLPITTVPAS